VLVRAGYVRGRGLALGAGLVLFVVEPGLFGTWPPAPGAPVLPWFPDVGPLDGCGDPMLPGDVIIPGVLIAPGDIIVLGELIGRGTIVCGALTRRPVVVPPLVEPLDIPPMWQGIFDEFTDRLGLVIPPPAVAAFRHMYWPLPLPYCAAPFV
jgi:hypothetical protein